MHIICDTSHKSMSEDNVACTFTFSWMLDGFWNIQPSWIPCDFHCLWTWAMVDSALQQRGLLNVTIQVVIQYKLTWRIRPCIVWYPCFSSDSSWNDDTLYGVALLSACWICVFLFVKTQCYNNYAIRTATRKKQCQLDTYFDACSKWHLPAEFALGDRVHKRANGDCKSE